MDALPKVWHRFHQLDAHFANLCVVLPDRYGEPKCAVLGLEQDELFWIPYCTFIIRELAHKEAA